MTAYRKTTKKEDIAVEDIVENETNIKEPTETDNKEVKTKKVTVKNTTPQQTIKKKVVLDLNDDILIKNGFAGTLVVKLPKSNYDIIFNSFGDEDYVPLGELKALRNRYPAMFEKNWIVIDDADVIEFLNVGKYYKGYLGVEEIDELFEMATDKMLAKIKTLNENVKQTVARRAISLIEDGVIDSRKTIEALEQELNYQLTE